MNLMMAFISYQYHALLSVTDVPNIIKPIVEQDKNRKNRKQPHIDVSYLIFKIILDLKMKFIVNNEMG